MLTAIREKTSGIVAAVIVGLIIVVFSLWGIESYIRGDTSLLVAEGDGVEVPKHVYQRTLERYKQSVPQQMWGSPFLKRQVVESLVNETLLLNEARSLGYRVSDKLLGEYIQGQSYFQNGGKFDVKTYKTALRSSNTSVREYESEMRENLALEQLRSGYRNSVIVTDALLNQALSLMLQKREIDYVIVNPGQFKSVITISAKEAEDYYNKNKSQYKTEEQVKVEYIELSASALAANYQPDEQELRDFYNQEGAIAALKKEKRRISHILVEGSDKAALDKARSLMQQLKDGASFAALAKKHSADPGSAEKGGDLGNLEPGVMVKEFEDAAMALNKTGELAGPVKSQFGYHIIKMTKYTPAVRKPFAKVKAELTARLRQRKGEELFFNYAETFNNLVFENPDSLQPAAQELGLKVKKTGFFSRRGGSSGITSKPKIVEAAFSNEVIDLGRNSEAIELGDTALVAVRMAERKESIIRPFAEVRPLIEKVLRDQKAAEKVRETASRLKTEAGKLGLARAAAAMKLRLISGVSISQEGSKDIDKQLTAAVFAANHPADKAVIGSADLGARGSAVFALNKVIAGEPKKADEAARKKIRDILERRQARDYFANFQAGLRQSANVKIYQQNM